MSSSATKDIDNAPRKSRRIDLTGRAFGRLTVLRLSHISHHSHWLCRCSCGNESVVAGSDLRSGHTQSCGCLHRESVGLLKLSHGGRRTRLYAIWSGMIGRCGNSGRACFPRYGGRGIRICEEWRAFPEFRTWALVHGYADNLTIDRIDNDLGYNPGNCRWVTRAENTGKSNRDRVKGAA